MCVSMEVRYVQIYVGGVDIFISESLHVYWCVCVCIAAGARIGMCLRRHMG